MGGGQFDRDLYLFHLKKKSKLVFTCLYLSFSRYSLSLHFIQESMWDRLENQKTNQFFSTDGLKGIGVQFGSFDSKLSPKQLHNSMSGVYVWGTVLAAPIQKYIVSAFMQLTIEWDNKQANKLWSRRAQHFPLNLTASCLCRLKWNLRSCWLFTTTSVDSFKETAFGNTCVTCGDYVFLKNRDLSKSVMRKITAFFSYKLPSDNLII